MPVGKTLSHLDQLILCSLHMSVQALFLGLCPLDGCHWSSNHRGWSPIVHVSIELFIPCMVLVLLDDV